MQKLHIAKKYPLSKKWLDIEPFEDVTIINSIKVFLNGFCVKNHQQMAVTASAGSLKNNSKDRAYFELIERSSIVEYDINKQKKLTITNINKSLSEKIPSSDIFPTPINPEKWRYARSNGVAVHTSWKKACENAFHELFERDTILRSWYGEICPQKISLPKSLIPSSWNSLYHFEAYDFPRPGLLKTSMVIGYPKRNKIPLIYGFSAKTTKLSSLKSALQECIQRLGFLWGEDLPHTPPSFSPTPDFHQEYFLYPPNIKLLKSWLSGSHTKYYSHSKKQSLTNLKPLFLDLTPPHLKGKLFVVKAYSPTAIPLIFGQKKIAEDSTLPKELFIHPIA